MKHISPLIVLLLVLCVSLFAQNPNTHTYRDTASTIQITAGVMEVYEYDWSIRKYNVYGHSIDKVGDHGTPFLLLRDTNQKWLFLSSPYFATVYKDELTPFFAEGTAYRPGFNYIIVGKYSVTSFLTDSSGSYPAANLRTDVPSKPWVEGVEGDGIGERISVDWLWRIGEGGSTGAMIISNGFVSYDKPQLYEMNGRVRRIRVSDPSGSFSIETELADTPNPQVVFLPSASERTDIEILSIYPGSAWHDTCVNYIYGLEATQSARLRTLMLEEGNAPLPVEKTGSRKY